MPCKNLRKSPTGRAKDQHLAILHLIMGSSLKNNIEILQYNLQRSQTITHSLLNHPDSMKFMALLVQEQYWSEYMKSSLTHHSWTLIQPTTTTNYMTHHLRPRSAIYINNHIISTSSFTPIKLPFNDVTAVSINMEESSKPMLLMNIYNPGNENLITPLRQYLQNNKITQEYQMIIIGGDFNLHHPLWNPQGYNKPDNQADKLIKMVGDYGL